MTSTLIPPTYGVATSHRKGRVVQWGEEYPWLGQPPELTDVVAISANGNHALALRSNGTVVGWGDDSEGTNVVPADLAGVIAVAAGWWHGLALLSDGTVVGWGQYGQDVPPGLSDVVALAAGAFHNLALRSMAPWSPGA